MNLKEYEKNAVFHTSGRCPVGSKKRVAYRTSFKIAGVRFVSHVHLGIEAGEINWRNEDNSIFKVYDYCIVQDRNILIEQSKTRKI